MITNIDELREANKVLEREFHVLLAKYELETNQFPDIELIKTEASKENGTKAWYEISVTTKV